MKVFRFQRFCIEQSKEVFAVGTDGVVLGALSGCVSCGNILEVGTGTGLISLMMAQRNPTAEITAIDIDERAVCLAGRNFINSPFGERLRVLHRDFCEYESVEKFDLIVSNPPYFEANSSVKHLLARQQVALSYENLIKKASELLAKRGRFSVIIPYDACEFFISRSRAFSLYLERKVLITGREGGKVVRVILEFSFEERSAKTEHFLIEKSPREYSAQYLEATEGFHLFGKG